MYPGQSEYYDERAEEYERLYTLGEGPGAVADSQAYQAEAKIMAGIAGEFCCGSVIDIACGTGFWLPHYVGHCSRVTLIDESAGMLSVCQEKVASLGVQDRCNLICDDFLSSRFGRSEFDCAIMGFFVSHLSEEEEREFFAKLRAILKQGGKFLIFDSAWNEERAKTREKEGLHRRELGDGRVFEVYKKYFEVEDIAEMARRYQFSVTVEHVGKVFIAASGQFS